jgi:hypothetical protein
MFISRAVSAERPEAFVDGWGDFEDPAALHVSCGNESIELAWNTKNSGVDFEALAKRFNDAVAALGT